jgi:hypothetical protein
MVSFPSFWVSVFNIYNIYIYYIRIYIYYIYIYDFSMQYYVSMDVRHDERDIEIMDFIIG